MSVTELLHDVTSRGLTLTAVGGDLRLQGPTERMDAELVARIRAAKPDLLAHLTAPAGLELTPLQGAYLYGRSELVELGNVASHVYHEIEGVWDVERLERALWAVVHRHDALRVSFTPDGRQIVHDRVPVRIRVRDLRALPERARLSSLESYRERCSHRMSPVDRPPLVRAEVSVLADDRMVLHVGHDGLVMDGISMFLFFREWWRAYQDDGTGRDGRDDPGVPLADYVAELCRARDRAPARRSRRYWTDRVDDLAPMPDLPLATSPSSIARPRFTQRLVRLDASPWRELKRRAAAGGITPPALLLAGYAQTLHFWGAGDRFTLNTTFANRPPIHPRMADAVGQFSDVMLVEVGFGTGATFEEWARSLQGRLHGAIENRHHSGVEVLRELGRRGRAARAPYTFNCAIGHVQADVDGTALELFGRETFTVSQTPQVWLNVFAMERHGGLVIQIDGVDELFPEGLLDALATGYQRLLDGLCAGDGWTAVAPDLLPPEQRRRRDEANDTSAPQSDRPLADAFAEHARRRPDAPAVIAGGAVMSYGELHRRARRVAAWLRRHQVGRDELVGLVMARGPEQIVGILGTVLAGAAYLPVDAGLPAARRTYMLRDGRVRCVLSNVGVPDGVPDGVEVLRLPGDVDAAAEEPADPSPPPGAGPDDLAYVLYTSGTTGDPKGVMVSRRSVANVVADCNARFGVDASDRFFGISAFNFDLSAYDVFGALSAGAAIVLPDADRAADPDHWLDLCASAGVTVWNSVPAIVGLLNEQAAGRPEPLPDLRLVMMSGDRIPPGLPAQLLRLKPDLEICSLGGPTETTIWNILHPVGAADDGGRSIPYGRPNANNRAYVLDAAGRDTPDWVTGEICAAGVGLARGYWGDPERTAERFRVDELPGERQGERQGERIYRTGDLGRYLPNGEIEILGRGDFQIKVNGYRIEAGEVETRLVGLETVKQAAVVRQEGARGDRLVAHLAAAGDARPDAEEIRGRLRVHLPDYMIPSAVVWHDALPLTRNGKVDRARLTAVVSPEAASAEAVSAEAEAEAEALSSEAGTRPPDGIAGEIAMMWRKVLDVPDVPYDATFYELGGDSLAAARVLVEVRRRFHVTIPLDQLYEVRTVAAMAARVAAARRGEGTR
ncbi:amino acid adenylation domain-containing protein [Microtetraspora glauca]|uniref:Phenyloxazoline synthase MbtB n=1 Tax=Microtetraspora glauca TaxID=1996 RepID=A0ABV3GL06_MICGL